MTNVLEGVSDMPDGGSDHLCRGERFCRKLMSAVGCRLVLVVLVKDQMAASTTIRDIFGDGFSFRRACPR